MKISQSPTREKYPLSKKKIIKKTFVSSFILIILLLFVWLGLIVADISSGLISMGILGLMALIIFFNYFYEKWYFAVYYYELGSDFITIKKGPVTPTEITIPYERIQDVYVDQDIMDRIMGLYDVHLSSATVSSGMEAHIDGVGQVAAHGLRDLLLQTVQKKIRKN